MFLCLQKDRSAGPVLSKCFRIKRADPGTGNGGGSPEVTCGGLRRTERRRRKLGRRLTRGAVHSS